MTSTCWVMTGNLSQLKIYTTKINAKYKFLFLMKRVNLKKMVIVFADNDRLCFEMV